MRRDVVPADLRIDTIVEVTRADPLGMFVDGNDEAGAVARAWQRVCERASAAALTAARAVEAGE